MKEYGLIKRQFELISEYLSWNLEFTKTFFAIEKDVVANNKEAIAEMKALGVKYCG